jgi:lysyl-tRNA synthetase class 2
LLAALRGVKKRRSVAALQSETLPDESRIAVSGSQDTFEASRTDKLRRLEELGIDPWGGRFDGHQAIAVIRGLPRDTTPPPSVRAAGRIVLRREMGKVHFLQIQDWSGRIQVYVGQKQVGETGWALAQLLDLGDLVGVDGTLGLTKTGELTIFATSLHFLSKSLLPHPDKWGGMQDIEFRLRHRYLDLIYSPETLERAQKRIKIVRTIRNYLDCQGYLEVELPTLHAIAGGAAARPFVTHHNALDIDLYLRIALELHLKRLLVGGIEKVYEIGRVFRNEGISPKHNPEFTMLELYEAYGDYRTIMDLTEKLIVVCVEALGEGLRLAYGEQTIDFTPPWQRATYAELFHKHVGVPMEDTEAVRQAAEKVGIATANKHPDVLVHQLFEHRVEHQLAGPVFVYDYPAALCPLTKRKRDNPAVAERFELYVQGMEVANAYTELNDPITQEATFRLQLAGLPEEDSMARMDEDFVRALRYGMPPAGGLGIGIDRLVMLLTNTQSIRDVILFPLLRPEKKSP